MKIIKKIVINGLMMIEKIPGNLRFEFKTFLMDHSNFYASLFSIFAQSYIVLIAHENGGGNSK